MDNIMSSTKVQLPLKKRGESTYSKKLKARNASCQVEGCKEEVPNKAYHQRYRICKWHASLPQMVLDGKHVRFCQHCGRFHPLAEFDGTHKSCRRSLELHRKSQNRRNLRKEVAKDAQCSPFLNGFSPYGPIDIKENSYYQDEGSDTSNIGGSSGGNTSSKDLPPNPNPFLINNASTPTSISAAATAALQQQLASNGHPYNGNSIPMLHPAMNGNGVNHDHAYPPQQSGAQSALNAFTVNALHNYRSNLPIDFNLDDFLHGSLAAEDVHQHRANHINQQHQGSSNFYAHSQYAVPLLRPQQSLHDSANSTHVATAGVHNNSNSSNGGAISHGVHNTTTMNGTTTNNNTIEDPFYSIAPEAPISTLPFPNAAMSFLNSMYFAQPPSQQQQQPSTSGGVDHNHDHSKEINPATTTAHPDNNTMNNNARNSLDAAKNLLQDPLTTRTGVNFDPKELLVRISLKLFNVSPHELPPLVCNTLQEIVNVSESHFLGNTRPGCTHVTLETFMSKEDAERLWLAGAKGVLRSCMTTSEMLRLLPRGTFGEPTVGVGSGNGSDIDTTTTTHMNTNTTGGEGGSSSSRHSRRSSNSSSSRGSHRGHEGRAVAQLNGSVAIATSPDHVVPMQLPETLPWLPKLSTVMPLAMTPEGATTTGIFLLGTNISEGHDMIVVRCGEYTPNMEVCSSGKLNDLMASHPEYGRPLVRSWEYTTRKESSVDHGDTVTENNTTTTNNDTTTNTTSGEYVHVVLHQRHQGLHTIEAQRGSILSNPMGVLILDDKRVVSEIRELEMDDSGVPDIARFVRSVGMVLDYLKKKEIDESENAATTRSSHAVALQMSSLAVSIARLCVARRWPTLLKLILPAIVVETVQNNDNTTAVTVKNPFSRHNNSNSRNTTTSSSSTSSTSTTSTTITAAAATQSNNSNNNNNDDDELSILHIAAASRSIATLPILREWAIDNNCAFECERGGAWGLTPLHLAALLDDDAAMAENLTAMYNKGAALWYKQTTIDGLTPAMVASIASNTAVLNWLSDQLPVVKEHWSNDDGQTQEERRNDASGSAHATDVAAVVAASASAAKAWCGQQRKKVSSMEYDDDGLLISNTLDDGGLPIEKKVRLFKGVLGTVWPYPLSNDASITAAAAAMRDSDAGLTLNRMNVVNFGTVSVLVLMMAYVLRVVLPLLGAVGTGVRTEL